MFKPIILSLCSLALLLPTQAQTRLTGGGNLNPDLHTSTKALKAWQDLRVGMCVHWGPSSLSGKEIGWSRSTSVPKNTYDSLYLRFNPERFDADQWCQLMKRWGMRYFAPTTKHHDGFALWFSDVSPYDMEATPAKRDLLAEMKTACDRHGILFGAYYSILDWYHPDCAPHEYGGPGTLIPKQADSPNATRYFDYMTAQVYELIDRYDVAFIQFDGEWLGTYTHEVGSEMYRRFHTRKPDILLNSRVDIGRRMAGADNHIDMDGTTYAGDFQDRERLTNRGNQVAVWGDHPWQAWVTLDKSQWSYNPTPKLMTATELVRDMVSIVGSNGNYMINLGPRPDGTFEEGQIALMDTLGGWLKSYGEAIYGTRGGPYYPYEGGVSTRNGKRAWLLVTDPSIEVLELPSAPQRLVSARDKVSGGKVSFTVSDKTTRFELPKAVPSEPVRVIELRFAAPVELCARQVL
ncbi:MAG TPA: alpha-L-fucosidase [Candidatus Rikenella faecigallinarum]|uniref:alpha-L-fucosidase n=1 Tax=Candidatus Rikenella faecigallinarum TaxID=2838745 RepID=A0A9D1QEA8_9BACT|nr:alpha-L-fucosidase [Candidatus Rikenella faecigallinarum]